MKKAIALCFFLLAAMNLFAKDLSCPEVKSLRIKECGGATLEALAKRGGSCSVAPRLYRFAQWFDSFAQPCSTILKEVKNRYLTYEEPVRSSIDYAGVPFEGAPDAAVRIVVYISMTCPLCKKLYCDLSDSLKNGRKSSMALYAKPFPSTQLEYAFAAVQSEGKQAELLRSLASVADRITLTTIYQCLAAIGIPWQTVDRLIRTRSTVAYVEASRAEALANGVTGAPTFFINNKRYRSYKDAQWIIEAADFELEKLHSNGKVR